MTNGINWKIGGQAGYGIMVTGKMFAKTCMRHGWPVFCYTEYPSLIRGGHNTYQVHAAKEESRSQKRGVEVLVALDELTIKENGGEVTEGGVIIYDAETMKIQDRRSKIDYLALPIHQISKEICGSDLMKDTVALGASLGLYQADMEIFNSVIRDSFEGKSEEVIKQNIEAAKKGYDFIKDTRYPSTSSGQSKIQDTKLEKRKAPARVLLTGNEAIGCGALAAGCKFYVAYPMTPATSILHFLAKNERDYDLMVKQAEDEISVINMAVGASFAGVRAMCATSGGGFALMNETLGFAAISETPIVIVESQRTGPATGLPTWTGQGELLYAINASHGEFLRVVIAPGDADEAYQSTIQAFNLADKYQIPVIILADKYLSESPQSVTEFSTKDVAIDRGLMLAQKELDKIKDFKRYEFTQSGISARSIPGQKGGVYQANSDDHDEYGYTSENAEIRNKIMDKRARKLSLLVKDIPEPIIYGDRKAKTTIICWGSTKMTVLEALKDLKNIRIVHLQYMFPFPAEFFKKNINPEQSIIIEGNQTAQLQLLIRQQTGLNIEKTLLKYDGRPFYPEEIIEVINQKIM